MPSSQQSFPLAKRTVGETNIVLRPLHHLRLAPIHLYGDQVDPLGNKGLQVPSQNRLGIICS